MILEKKQFLISVLKTSVALSWSISAGKPATAFFFLNPEFDIKKLSDGEKEFFFTKIVLWKILEFFFKKFITPWFFIDQRWWLIFQNPELSTPFAPNWTNLDIFVRDR